MFAAIRQRLLQKHRTVGFPATPPVLPARLLGRPEVHPERCPADCARCGDVCPTGAIEGHPLRLDLGRCTFCGRCAEVCPAGAVAFTREYALAARRREDLVLEGRAMRLAEALDKRSLKLFGRSLKLRQVSSGGCGACEADVNVLTTIVFDLGRFGIDFVASPRHADGLYVTGPTPENMRTGLLETWRALPEPRLCIAAGACSISGGLFHGLLPGQGGTPDHLPVDLFIPGCPPHPITALHGMLRLLERI